MKRLALDLSTRRGSVALADEAEILFARDWANDRRTAAPFFETIADVLKEFGSPEIIIVGLGPGSYTGTRIAIATGLGLAATTGAQLCGLPSVLGLGDDGENFVALGDAKRATFFFAQICGGDLSEAPKLFSRAELERRLGSVPIFSSDDLPDFPGVELRFPRATRLLEIARVRPQNLVRAPLTPIYLREPHITK